MFKVFACIAVSPIGRLLGEEVVRARGYIPDDAAYEQVSYKIQVSRVKPGCGENAIANGLLEMSVTKRPLAFSALMH